MSFIQFTPNPAGLAELFHSPSGAVMRHMAKMAKAVAESAQARAPKVTGTLAGSIHIEFDALGYSVVAAVPYAQAVTRGTKPHKITAHGQALKFPSRGSGPTVFRSYVNHPGTRANDFLNDALVEVVAALA